MTVEKEISLNELPSHSGWIPYLMGLKKLEKNLAKSAESLTREYDIEKWGQVLELLKRGGATLDQADALFIKDIEQAYYTHGKLMMAPGHYVHRGYLELLTKELKKEIGDSKHIVELGAGYGSILLKLSRLPWLEHVSFTAGEYAKSGVESIKLLAGGDSRIKAGRIDLSALDLAELSPSENSIIMTSWTMVCLKGFSEKTLNEILSYKPSMVMHFEPVFEHWEGGTLLEMLWKRYLQLNDYNQSMLTSLKEYEARGLIKIVEERKNVYGINPLMPASIIKWVPCLK
jgi:hypothetical protein